MTLTARATEWLTYRELDVELADRMGLTSSKRGGGEALVIPTYRDGRVVARKYRLFDKPDQKWATEGETCFWNEDVLRDRTLDGQPLVITEGQWDGLAAIQCGFQRTVSVPNGAPPANATDGEPAEKERYRFIQEVMPQLTFERFPEIILATDSDAPGQQLLHDLSIQLGRARCKFVSYGDGKDLNDVLVAKGPPGVVGCLTAAKFVALPGIYLLSEMPPLAPETIYDIGSEARGMRNMGECYRMRLGDLAIVTGVPGFGKTSFVDDIVCRVVDHYGLRAAWASFERAPQRDMRRAFTKWYGGRDGDNFAPPEACSKWIDDHHVIIQADEDEDVTLDWLLDALEGVVLRHGCKLVVIDPWNEIEHCRRAGENETEYVGRAIRTLKRFARKFQVHLILVAHPAKLQKDNGKYAMPSLYDIAGSANFYNKADIGLIVHRDSPTSSKVRIQKVRIHGVIGKPGEIAFDYRSDTARFVETERLA